MALSMYTEQQPLLKESICKYSLQTKITFIEDLLL